MKRLCLVGTLALLSLMLVVSTASAKDMSGRLGIGVDQSLAGASGLSIRYQTAKSFGLEAIFGLGWGTWGDGTVDSDGKSINLDMVKFQFAVRGDLNIAYTNDVNLSIPFGIDLWVWSTNEYGVVDNNDDMATQVDIEAGLKVEWFVTDFFSIHGEIGIVLYLVGQAKEAQWTGAGTPHNSGPMGVSPMVDASSMELSFLNNGELLGKMGFTFWFP